MQYLFQYPKLTEKPDQNSIYSYADAALHVFHSLFKINISLQEIILLIVKDKVSDHYEIVREIQKLELELNSQKQTCMSKINQFREFIWEKRYRKIFVRFYGRLSELFYKKLSLYSQNQRFLKFISFDYHQLQQLNNNLLKWADASNFDCLVQILEYIIDEDYKLLHFLIQLIVDKNYVTSIDEFNHLKKINKQYKKHHINDVIEQSEDIGFLTIQPKKIKHNYIDFFLFNENQETQIVLTKEKENEQSQIKVIKDKIGQSNHKLIQKSLEQIRESIRKIELKFKGQKYENQQQTIELVKQQQKQVVKQKVERNLTRPFRRTQIGFIQNTEPRPIELLNNEKPRPYKIQKKQTKILLNRSLVVSRQKLLKKKSQANIMKRVYKNQLWLPESKNKIVYEKYKDIVDPIFQSLLNYSNKQNIKVSNLSTMNLIGKVKQQRIHHQEILKNSKYTSKHTSIHERVASKSYKHGVSYKITKTKNYMV